MRFLLILSAFLFVSLAGAEESFPRKPVKVVVPFGSGGSSDTTARIVQEGIRREKLSPQPFAIINVPGNGGTQGSRRVKNSRSDGYTILNLHDAILTARYNGSVVYGPSAFEPIASTGSSHTMVCAGPKSTWTSLEEVLAEAAEKPGSILFGCNPGAPSHFAGLLLQDLKEGAEFKMVPLGGGAERFANLAGGLIQLSVFSASEFREFQQTPERPEGLKAVAFLAEERHPLLPEAPTAREQGFDLVSGTTQYWWAPKGTPPERIEVLADILEAALKTDFVKERYAEQGIEPICLRGAALTQALTDADTQLAALKLSTAPMAATLPMIPVLIGGSLLFGILAFLRREEKVAKTKVPATAWRRPLILLAALGIYGLLLNLRLLPYWLATFLFAATIGLLFTDTPRNRVIAVAVAALLGVGLDYLFKQIFVIDLP